MNYLQFIDPAKLVGKKITKTPSTYTIFAAQKHKGKLYLALADVEAKTISYGEYFVNEEIEEIKNLDLSNYCDERSDETFLFPTVIEVRDLFLLRKEGRDKSDVSVIEDWDNSLFDINEIYHETTDEFNGVYGDPFIVDGKPATSYKEIDFSPEEHQLRNIFAKVLPEDLGEKYLREFNQYCYNRILKLNSSYVNYTKAALQESEDEYKAKNAAYLNAVEGLLKVQTKLKKPSDEQSSDNDEKGL